MALLNKVLATTLFSTALASAALADGSIKDAPEAAPARALSLSITAGGTSDYVFRGVSQSSEDPAAQGSIDLGYGIAYAGIWGSVIDFDGAPKATAEVDFYAGIKPVWGPVTFDLGVIYYAYPRAQDSAAELDYVELKAGYSMASPWIKNLTTGTTLYWSPDYTFEAGSVFTVESAASYALPQLGKFTPTITGAYGTVYGDSSEGFSVNGTTDDQYSYWNAGLSLAVEKFTFDFRYWDTDIKTANAAATVCTNVDLCEQRFVFTAKVTLP